MQAGNAGKGAKVKVRRGEGWTGLSMADLVLHPQRGHVVLERVRHPAILWSKARAQRGGSLSVCLCALLRKGTTVVRMRPRAVATKRGK